MSYLAHRRKWFDADALAFLDAASISDSTIRNATTQLVINLKDAGLWTKMAAIYPLVGGTATTHKWNLKDPRDLDAAFRLAFSGGFTHSSTGVLPNGTTGYASTYLIPDTSLTAESMSLGYYSRSDTNTATDQIDLGVTDAVDFLWLSPQYDSGGFVDRFLARNSSVSVLADTANADARGFYLCSKTSNAASTFKTYKNGGVEATNTGSGDNPATYDLMLFAYNNSGLDRFHTNRECAFASIGDGLTDTESLAMYNAVQAFQTTLSRQV